MATTERPSARPFWGSAFGISSGTIWGGTPFESEVDDISYYRALTAFYYETPKAMLDRQEALFYFLIGEWKSSSDDDIINRVRRQIPTESIVGRVVRNIANLYSEPPIRLFGDSTDAKSKTNDNWKELYDSLNVDFYLREAHRQARLAGVVALRYHEFPTPAPMGGVVSLPRWDILTPADFRVIVDENDARRVSELWIPYGVEGTTKYHQQTVDGNEYTRTEETVFYVWTDEEFKIVDAGGKKVLSSEPNKYGRIPYVFIQTNYSTSFYPGGLMALVQEQIEANKLRLISNLSASFDSTPILTFVNYGFESGPPALQNGRILTADGVSNDETTDMPPYVDQLNPSGSYREIDELRVSRIKSALRGQGLPASFVESQTVTSGVARMIERAELTDLRQNDVVVMSAAEKDLKDLIGRVQKVDVAQPQFDPETELSIDYAEQVIQIEPTAEYELDRQKVADLVLSKLDFIRKWSGVDNSIDDKSLLAQVSARKVENDTITGELGENEDPDAEGEDDIDDNDNETSGAE